MFVEERQTLIYEELQSNGRVRVKDLSKKFNVSEDLIRKDLNVLEREGKLRKIYGGAVLAKENVQRKLASQRKNINLDAKKNIAKKAISIIEPGDIIFLDISTSSIEIAKLLINVQKPMTVITNMLDVINILATSNVNVIFVGGELDYGHDGFVGSLTNQMIDEFRFDKAFLGVVGVDISDNSVMTYMPADAQTKRLILSHSKESYMLCELEKFNQIGNYQYAKIEDFYGLICDKDLSLGLHKELKLYDIKVIE